MPKLTNACLDPGATNAALWVKNDGTGGASTMAVSADVTAPSGSGSCILRTWTTAPTASGYEYAQVATASAAAGQRWSGSVWIKPSVTRSYVLIADFLNSGGGAVGSVAGASVSCPAGVWTKITVVNALAPATTDRVLPLIEWTGNPTAGENFRANGALMVQSTTLPTYFDGNVAPAHWTGTVNDSTSVLPALDVVVDTVNMRTSLTLDGFGSADGSITISRVHPDGSTYAVRDTPFLSSGVAFTHDYELPLLQGVYYIVDDSGATVGGVVTSSTVTLNVDQFWLRAPGQPDFDMAVTVEAKPQITRPRQQATLRPVGRSRAVVLSGPRGGAEFSLQIKTTTSAAADDLQALVEAAPTCLLLMPGTRLPWAYVAIGDAQEAPVAPWRSVVTGDAGDQAVWTLPCIEVDQPVGAVTADSSFNYGTVLAEYATYTALKAANATYLALEQGL